MIFDLEIFHPQLNEYKLFVEENLIEENQCNQHVLLEVPAGKISLWFYPWKIVPHIRINNFLINTGLAEIDMFDHKFDVTLSENFFSLYHENDLRSREATFSMNQNGKIEEILYDKVLGIKNSHQELVDQIRNTLNV